MKWKKKKQMWEKFLFDEKKNHNIQKKLFIYTGRKSGVLRMHQSNMCF